MNHSGKSQTIFVKKVETRAQLKLKSVVKNEYIRRYFAFINAFDRNKGYFSSDYDSTDYESIIPDNKESKKLTLTLYHFIIIF